MPRSTFTARARSGFRIDSDGDSHELQQAPPRGGDSARNDAATLIMLREADAELKRLRAADDEAYATAWLPQQALIQRDEAAVFHSDDVDKRSFDALHHRVKNASLPGEQQHEMSIARYN